MAENKSKMSPDTDPMEKLKTDLSELGRQVKEWDGEETRKLMEPIGEAVKTSLSVYKETNDPNYLLCSYILQMIFSFMMTKDFMSNFLKTKYVISEKVTNRLGELIIDLSKKTDSEDMIPILTSILVLSYENELIPLPTP